MFQRNFLKIARNIISRMPRGKSIAIKAALAIGGDMFGDIITVKDGRKFFIGKISLVKRHLFFVNEYEEGETSLMKKIVKPGNYVFDVGASFGWFTTLLSKLVRSSGKVFSFELAPNIAEECRTNMQLSGLGDNVILEDLALGEAEGSVGYIYSETLGLGNLNPQGLTGAGQVKEGTGRMTTLDKYVQRSAIRRIDFIKCDIDGAEVRFLKGARETIAAFKPIIVIEASGQHGRNSCYEIFNELNKLGYAFFSLHHKRFLKTIEANKFDGNFKENILCLPSDKLSILKTL